MMLTNLLCLYILLFSANQLQYTLFPYTTLFRSLADSVRRFIHKDYDFESRKKIVASAEGWSEKAWGTFRSEEHTSELQSHHDLVCRLLLEKKKHFIRSYALILYIILHFSEFFTL